MPRNRLLIVTLLAGLVGLMGCGSSSVPTSATTATTAPNDGLVAIGEGLRGPAGLHASVYATGLIHASAFAVDAQSRLWVATAEFEDKGADAVYVVPSAGAAPVKAIGDLHTPLGLLWYQDSLYVASKERVDAYSNFNGATFTDHRSVESFPEGSGSPNGLVLGSDGRISLGISAPCDACTPDLALSGSVVSFLPDGSDLRVDAAAVRAPVGLAFYPGTADLFVTMNQRDDLGAATPGDLLSVVASGQHWGFPGCYGQGGAACDGVPAPVATLDEHAAVSGVAIATGQLGPVVGNAAVVAEWATGRVVQVALDEGPATRGASGKPLVTGIEKPEPVLLGGDGALFVGDWQTGKVFRIAAS